MLKSTARLAVVNESPRIELRSAIAKHTDAIAELARISSARVHARETSTAAGARLHDLQTAFDNAKRRGDADLAATALGEVDAAPQVGDADLARAVADRDVAKRTERALAEREEHQHTRVTFALRDVEQAVAGVIQSEASTAVAALLSKAKQQQAELVASRAELKYLFNAKAIAEPLAQQVNSYLAGAIGVLPCIDGHEREDFSLHPATNVWRTAMAKLRVDASAPMPE